jgi:HSP20 family protein
MKGGGLKMGDIVKRDSFRSLFAMPRWLDEFDDMSAQKGLKLHEDDKNIYIEAVVAGVPAEQVDVEIEDGVVTVKAENKEEENKKNEYKSSSYRYYYTCALSGGKWDKANAEVKHGVVVITVPKEEAKRPRKVKVNASAK